MLKQNNNNIECSIEINPDREKVDFPTSKIFTGPIIAFNAMILAITPLPKLSSLSVSNETAFIKEGNNADIFSYPTVEFRYEGGRLINFDTDKNINAINNRTEESISKVPTADIIFKQVIGELRKENAVLRTRLTNSFPTHTLIYLIINSVVSASAATLLFVRFVLNIYIIDPYYLICALIISIGLFSTALVSLKDWKENLLNEKRD